MKSIEKIAQETQKELLHYVNKVDIKGVTYYINQHQKEINTIVEKYGSASNWLTLAYDTAYDAKYYDFLRVYQEEIEKINDVALFGEDGQ